MGSAHRPVHLPPAKYDKIHKRAKAAFTLQGLWFANSKQLEQDPPQIVRRRGNQVAFCDLGHSFHPTAPHAAPVTDMGKCPLTQLAAESLPAFALVPFDPTAIRQNCVLDTCGLIGPA